MDREEIIDTLHEIVDYFEGCMGHTAPVSAGRRRFRKYIKALERAIVDEAIEKVYEEADEE